jgi:NTP pyrophosphatase (non-canonical NTP hydrolase)
MKKTVQVDFSGGEFIIKFRKIDELQEKVDLLRNSLNREANTIRGILNEYHNTDVEVNGREITYSEVLSDNAKRLIHNSSLVTNNLELMEIEVMRPKVDYFEKIVQWGKDKGILDHGTVATQFSKLIEEVTELGEGIERESAEEIEDAIGDCIVVLTLLAKLCKMDVETCIKSAYNEIKGRTGRMENGQFLRDK